MEKRWFVQFKMGHGDWSAFIPTGCTDREKAEEYARQYSAMFLFNARVVSWIQL